MLQSIGEALRCCLVQPQESSKAGVAAKQLNTSKAWQYSSSRFAPPPDAEEPEQPTLQDSYRDPLFAALNGRRPPSFREQFAAVPPLGSAKMKRASRTDGSNAGGQSTGGSTRTASGSASTSSSRSASASESSFMTPTAAMAMAFAKKAEQAESRAKAAAAFSYAKAVKATIPTSGGGGKATKKSKPTTPNSKRGSSPSARERAAARSAAQFAAAAAKANEPYLAPGSGRLGTPGRDRPPTSTVPHAPYMAATKSAAAPKKKSGDEARDASEGAPASPWRTDRRDWERMRWENKYV